MKSPLKPNIFSVILAAIILATLLQLQAVFINGNQTSVWAQNSSQNQPEPTQVSESVKFKPERIVIEKVNLDLPIISVPLKNGTWAVNDKAANYAEGTSLVNLKQGNVGLFGHAQSNAFLPIKNIVKDSQIIIYGSSYKAVYKVTTTQVVKPTQVDVFYPQEKPILTLITCDGPNDINRYMIRAELITIVKAN